MFVGCGHGQAAMGGNGHDQPGHPAFSPGW
jgi:hypothetical protein